MASLLAPEGGIQRGNRIGSGYCAPHPSRLRYTDVFDQGKRLHFAYVTSAAENPLDRIDLPNDRADPWKHMPA